MKALLILLIVLTSTTSHAAWDRLLVRGRAIAAWSAQAVRVSFDGGRRFREVALDGATAVALTPRALYVADKAGLRMVRAQGAPRSVKLPATGEGSDGPMKIEGIQGLGAGPGWLLVVPSDPEFALLRRGGRWTSILKMNARGWIDIDAHGHTLAQWAIDAGCGGGDEGFGGVWRPDRPARPLPDALTPLGSTYAHRDWVLGDCGDDDAACLFSPARHRYRLPGRHADLVVSPAGRWIATSDGAVEPTVTVHRRAAGRLTAQGRARGTVIGARRDGVTVVSVDRRLIRIGDRRVELPPPPDRPTHFDIDPRGRVYALGAGGLQRLDERGWTRLHMFDAPEG